MSTADTTMDACLRSLVRAIVHEVLSEVGQNAAPRLHDVDEAAEILKVPKRWLYERTSAGTIPHQKLGKFIRFTDADLRSIMGGE
jgi:excisionase family DNA binding protein